LDLRTRRHFPEWDGLTLKIGGYGAPGVNGDALSVDNLTESSFDHHNRRSYDGAGRLATETDGAGLVTTYTYDGASRLISTSVNQAGAAAILARETRMFYDNDGHLVATLDAAGYLTVSSYDLGGRLTKTVGYSTMVDSSAWAPGTFTAPAAAAGDTQTRYFYDGTGRLMAELKLVGGTTTSAQGYLTDYFHDEANNHYWSQAYSKVLTGLTGNESLGTLRSAAVTGAPAELYRGTHQYFNGLGQLDREVNAEGTVTKYLYDEAGQLIRTTANDGGPVAEVRDFYRRYDVFGNLIGEMTPEQAVRAGGAALLTMDETALNTAYANYGTDAQLRRRRPPDRERDLQRHHPRGSRRQDLVFLRQARSQHLHGARHCQRRSCERERRGAGNPLRRLRPGGGDPCLFGSRQHRRKPVAR
jgi:YD repeat-containing protein